MTKIMENIKPNLFLCPILLSNNSKNKENKNSFFNTSKFKLRPKLNIKKSFSFNNIKNPDSNINNSKTIQIINAINITQYNNIYTEGKKPDKLIDNESLKMKNKEINKEIHKIKKILINVNEQNKRKDEEIDKQGNLIDQILNINKQAYKDTLDILEKNYNKDKNKNFNDLLDKLYIQYKELEINNNAKDSEIKNLKKNIKNTKKNELIIENNILMNQYNKYKILFNEIEKKNERYKIKIRNKPQIENEILEKNFEILQLQENLKLVNTINIQKENEKLELINKIKELQNKNKDIKNKINQLNQEYNYILLSKKDLEDNLYIAYNNNELNDESDYNDNNNKKDDSLSSNMNSNNLSNVINKNNNYKKDEIKIDNNDNITNSYEEILNYKDINIKKNKIFEDDNNMNTVDEEKITNIESETNFKKDYIIEKEKKQTELQNNINNIDDLSNKNRLKYNESFIEKNSDLSNIDEN